MKIPANQSAAVQVTFKNANGAPAKVQGDVSWESSNESIAKVQVKPDDTMQAMITAGPSAGTATITAIADADMGEGVREAEATIEVEVVARGEAVGGEITRAEANQGLPGGGARPDNTLPGGSGGRPDQSLPGSQPQPDQGLPGSQPRPDQGLPGGSGGRPDNSLPGSQPKPDQGLPGSGARPDQGLPETGSPKRR